MKINSLDTLRVIPEMKTTCTFKILFIGSCHRFFTCIIHWYLNFLLISIPGRIRIRVATMNPTGLYCTYQLKLRSIHLRVIQILISIQTVITIMHLVNLIKHATHIYERLVKTCFKRLETSPPILVIRKKKEHVQNEC